MSYFRHRLLQFLKRGVSLGGPTEVGMRDTAGRFLLDTAGRYILDTTGA